MELSQHLDKLKAFKLVAEVGKLHDAALRLHVTQPSLTRLIQTLEYASGQKLFHRSRQGVVLTEAGKLLLIFSSVVLKNLEDLEEKIKNPKVEVSGLLRIGSYESLAEYFWPEFVRATRKLYPELKLAIRTSGAFQHQKVLENAELDMLVDAEPRIVGDFTSWVLYEDKFNFYGQNGALEQELNTEAASSLPLIYCPTAFDQDNKSILQHLEVKGYLFKEKIELDSFTAVATFTKTGLGLGILPQRLASASVKSKLLCGIAMKGFSPKGFGTHNICATVRSSSVDDKRIRLLVKLLREWFKR